MRRDGGSWSSSFRVFCFCVFGDGGGYLSGGDNFALAGRLATIFVLVLASKESNVFTLAGRLAIIIFVLFLASKESNVFFVLISIII